MAVTTKRAVLRPASSYDLVVVADVLTASPEWRGDGHRWPTVADPVLTASDGVVAQAAICRRSDSDDVAGVVQLLCWDRRTSSAELSVGLREKFWKMVWPLEGVVAFVGWSFRTFELDVIRISMPDKLMERHGLRLHRWASFETSVAGVGRWRLVRSEWEAAGAERLVGLSMSNEG